MERPCRSRNSEISFGKRCRALLQPSPNPKVDGYRKARTHCRLIKVYANALEKGKDPAPKALVPKLHLGTQLPAKLHFATVDRLTVLRRLPVQQAGLPPRRYCDSKRTFAKCNFAGGAFPSATWERGTFVPNLMAVGYRCCLTTGHSLVSLRDANLRKSPSLAIHAPLYY